MQYVTGAANDHYDVLDKLRLFLIDMGFTIHSYVTDQNIWYPAGNKVYANGTVNQKRLHASKGGRCLNFRSFDSISSPSFFRPFNGPYANWGSYPTASLPGICFNVGDGYNAAHPWCSQPGTPNWTTLSDSGLNEEAVAAGGGRGAGVAITIPGAVASYHFFYQDAPFLLWVGIEWTVGKFQHLMCCDLDKSGNYGGGLFFTGSCAGENVGLYSQPNEVDAPFCNSINNMFLKLLSHPDGDAGWGRPWMCGQKKYYGNYSSYSTPLFSLGAATSLSPVGPGFAITTPRGETYPLTMLLGAAPTTLNGVAPLLPIFISCTRANNRASLLGVIPDVFQFTSEKPVDKGAIQYGGKTYVTLPLNWFVSGESQNLYFAIRKV